MLKIMEHYSLDAESNYDKLMQNNMEQRMKNINEDINVPLIEYEIKSPISNSIEKIEGILKYSFNNKNLIIQSFIAPNMRELQELYKFSKKTSIQENCELDYERLEFLGDAVLDFIIVELLWTVLVENNSYMMKID